MLSTGYHFVELHVTVDPMSFEPDVGCLVIMRQQHWNYVRDHIEPWLINELGYQKWWPTSDRMTRVQNYAFKFKTPDDAAIFILKWC